MIDTVAELMEYLDARGANYGISGEELYEAIPSSAQEPSVAYEYMQQKDISHIEPLSKGGDPAGDNWILEDSSVNRARGAETVTPTEQAIAHIDNNRDALVLSVQRGATMAATGALVNAAIAAAPAAISTATAATATTVATAATVATTVATAGTVVIGTAMTVFPPLICVGAALAYIGSRRKHAR